MSESPLLALARQRGLLARTTDGRRDPDQVLIEEGLTADEVDALRRQVEAARQPPVIPGYRILGRLGSGASSNVWHAFQESMSREVAVKVVPLRSERDRERFLREAQIAGSISDPHVVSCHESGSNGASIYLVMELVTGGDAEQALQAAGGRFESRRALEIVRDAAQGLSALWTAGVVHRDIKPANILLSATGAKLSDFGLSRTSEAGGDSARPVLEGTPAFMSPEQVAGRALDVRSDIFSLGSCLYAFVTGQRPFNGATVIEVLRRISEGPSPDPHEAEDAVRCIILVAMAADRDLRYAHPDELAMDAQAVLSGAEPQHARRLRRQAFERSLEAESHRSGHPLALNIPWYAMATLTLTLAIGIASGYLVTAPLTGPSRAERAVLLQARSNHELSTWQDYLRLYPHGSASHEAAAALDVLAARERQRAQARTDQIVLAELKDELAQATAEVQRLERETAHAGLVRSLDDPPNTVVPRSP